MLENRYAISETLYAQWACHPVMLGGRRLPPLLPCGLTLGGAAVLVLSAARGDVVYMGLSLLLVGYGVYRLAFQLSCQARRQYRALLRARGTDRWDRVITLSPDNIRVTDGPASVDTPCAAVREVRDLGDWLALVLDSGAVIRLNQSGFFREGAPLSAAEALTELRRLCPAAFPA